MLEIKVDNICIYMYYIRKFVGLCGCIYATYRERDIISYHCTVLIYAMTVGRSYIAT